MKILQIIQKQQLRGVEIFTAQLSNHFIQKGHSIELASLDAGTQSLPFSQVIQSMEATLRWRFFDFRTWKRLAALIKEFDPDVVQLNAGDTLKYAVLSKWIFRWKHPIVFRNASVMSQYTTNLFIVFLNKLFLKSVDHIISVSTASRDDLIRNMHVPEKKITTIPIGTEIVDYRPVARKTGYFHLIHVGGFTFEKNHVGLLRIFESLHKLLPNLRLWLLGDGHQRRHIEHLVVERNLSDCVEFMGNVSNPHDYIAASDVMLLPSIIEGLPAVILEAFQCRTPVVAYDSGGIPELINEETGWLIPKNNERAFMDTVKYILENMNSADVRLRKEHAYMLLAKRYLNTFIADEFLMVYNKIIYYDSEN